MKAAILAILAVGLLVTHGLAATYKPSDTAAAKPASAGLTKYGTTDGTFLLEAKTVEGSDNKMIATGKAHVRSYDPATKRTLDAYAEKMVVVRCKPVKGKPGSMIQSAELTGPVKMVYIMVDANGVTTKTVATADSADFDGVTSVAHLVGNVKITNENPALFALPAVMSGDKATVNLSPNLGPEDVRFRVESAPGVSSITVTPNAKETQ